MADLIHRDGNCIYCGRRPRRMRCVDCDAEGIVLTCEHAQQPAPFQMVGKQRFCMECADERRAETAADPLGGVVGAVGTVVGLGVGLGVAGAMLGAFDGDDGGGDGMMFDF